MSTVITTPPPKQDDFLVRAKVAMLRQGTNGTQIANELGLARTTVSQAINHNMHRPTRIRIAQHLGIAP